MTGKSASRESACCFIGDQVASYESVMANKEVNFRLLLNHFIAIPNDEVRIVELPLRPYGMYWNDFQKDDILEITVAGNPVILFPIPGVRALRGENTGTHIIHCLAGGDDSSCLIIPCV
ncbi:hypothetical protein IFM47457_03015 [Aspergillus lentulus]|nr:hypothetical protein IFM47457_03015 [Aspergillus lentulus]